MCGRSTPLDSICVYPEIVEEPIAHHVSKAVRVATKLRLIFVSLLLALLASCANVGDKPTFSPGARVVLNAHNCYPYEGDFVNRIDRALSTGLPVSIELDLALHRDPATGTSRSVLSHSTETHGDEPGLAEYFFERVRPIVEQELAQGDTARWPVIYLHFNFKSTEREHVEHVAKTLADYQTWLSSSIRNADPSKLEAIEAKPILVMTEIDPTEKAVFYDDVPVGSRFYVFGSAPGEQNIAAGTAGEARASRMVTAKPEEMLAKPADNYRRWWNNSWAVVEEGGASRAGDWTNADAARLEALVSHAHRLGYLIRFYTLNGHPQSEGEGWGSSYNFGSLSAARVRWEAARSAGVDFIASDQYEELGKVLRSEGSSSATGESH